MELDRWLGRPLACAVLGLSLCTACGDDAGDPKPWTGGTHAHAGANLPAAGGGSPPAGCPVTPPTVCPEPKPTFASVKPLFEQHCQSCHDGMHEQWPLTSYQHVADWFGEIRAQLIACTMPPAEAASAMTLEDRMRILTWIRCGYLP